MGFTTKQKQRNSAGVAHFLYTCTDRFKTRETHRRPEDHAQAKIDAENKRERRRWRRSDEKIAEDFAALDRRDLMEDAQWYKRPGQSAFDYLCASGLVRS